MNIVSDMTKSVPSIHILANSIPEAHYMATEAVMRQGMQIPTEYDGNRNFPPSRDAQVLINITNPFNQPRYPIISCSEIGTYIAEIMGAKDHKVIPFDRLLGELKSEKGLSSFEWPYSYHQRLASFPLNDGNNINQMETIVDRVAKSPITRRAVATTRLPQVDNYLKDDLPCLGEVQLRCTEDQGELYLNMNTRWRSRDLLKAWHDNVIGLTFMQQTLANKLTETMGRKVNVGGYSDFAYSLHIYGQDMVSGGSIGMTAEQYLKMGKDQVMSRAMDSPRALDNLVLPQLEELLSQQKIDEWGFGEPQIKLIKGLISDLNTGKLTA
jgi:hypothetical protein